MTTAVSRPRTEQQHACVLTKYINILNYYIMSSSLFFSVFVFGLVKIIFYLLSERKMCARSPCGFVIITIQQNYIRCTQFVSIFKLKVLLPNTQLHLKHFSDVKKKSTAGNIIKNEVLLSPIVIIIGIELIIIESMKFY